MEINKIDKALMKPASFARLCEMSRANVYKLIEKGELRAVRIGGSIRIPISELNRLIAAAIVFP
jgi:excisionase family DNA binding protein